MPVKVVGSEIVASSGSRPMRSSRSGSSSSGRAGSRGWPGKTQTLTLDVHDSDRSTQHALPHPAQGAPLTLRFKSPVAGLRVRHIAEAPDAQRAAARRSTVVTLPHNGTAGTMFVAAQIRPWETSPTAQISYFPGRHRDRRRHPKPGATINPTTPITLNFSKPVSKVLGSHTPTLTPATTGSWQQITSHAIQFVPSGYGYGLDAKVQIAMPNGVRLLGGTAGHRPRRAAGRSRADRHARPAAPGRPRLPAAEVQLRRQGRRQHGRRPGERRGQPAEGHLQLALPEHARRAQELWQLGASGVMTQGALMVFETDHGLTADGLPGPAVWKALINATSTPASTFGYTFVTVTRPAPGVHDALAQRQDGHLDPGQYRHLPAPTATGTYPVFEHLTSTTMCGTNPDGSPLQRSRDPLGQLLQRWRRSALLRPRLVRIPAVHGCVEMPVQRPRRGVPLHADRHAGPRQP